jgi:hypothetical protein
VEKPTQLRRTTNKNLRPVPSTDKPSDKKRPRKKTRKKISWAEIFAKLDAAGVPEDFLSPEERNQGFPQEREGLFDDWPDDPPDAESCANSDKMTKC